MGLVLPSCHVRFPRGWLQIARALGLPPPGLATPTGSPSCPVIPAKVPGLAVIGQNRISCHFRSHSLWSPGRGQAPMPVPGLRGASPPRGVRAVAGVGAVRVGRERLSPDGRDVLIFNLCVWDNLGDLKRKNPAGRHSANCPHPRKSEGNFKISSGTLFCD